MMKSLFFQALVLTALLSALPLVQGRKQKKPKECTPAQCDEASAKIVKLAEDYLEDLEGDDDCDLTQTTEAVFLGFNADNVSGGNNFAVCCDSTKRSSGDSYLCSSNTRMLKKQKKPKKPKKPKNSKKKKDCEPKDCQSAAKKINKLAADYYKSLAALGDNCDEFTAGDIFLGYDGDSAMMSACCDTNEINSFVCFTNSTRF